MTSTERDGSMMADWRGPVHGMSLGEVTSANGQIVCAIREDTPVIHAVPNSRLSVEVANT